MHDYCSIAETSVGHLRDCTTLTQLRRRVAMLNNTRLPTEGPVGRSRAIPSAFNGPATTCLGLRSYPTRKRHSSSLTSSGLTCMNFHRSYLTLLNSVLLVILTRRPFAVGRDFLWFRSDFLSRLWVVHFGNVVFLLVFHLYFIRYMCRIIALVSWKPMRD